MVNRAKSIYLRGLIGDKSDVLNKSGRRKTDAENIILNRDYFIIPDKICEYLRLHGCERVAVYLIHDECVGPRNCRPVIAVVPSSSNSLTHTVKSTSVLVNESKGKKHPLGVSNNVKAVAVPDGNNRKSDKDTKSLSAPLILPIQKKKVQGKIESASLLLSNALVCPMSPPSVIVDKNKGMKCPIGAIPSGSCSSATIKTSVTIPPGLSSSSLAAIESNNNIDTILEEKAVSHENKKRARPEPLSTAGNDYVIKLLNTLLLKMFGT
jgi:hypothetical protein